MNSLVVYYSRTGTTKKVGQLIAKKLKANCEEILDVKSRMSKWGFIISCFESALKTKPKIKPLKKNAANYDCIIMGAPVWAATMASPLMTYIAQNKDKFRKVAFFCTSGADNPQKTFINLEKLCAMKPLAVFHLRQEQVDKGDFKVDEFVKKLK